MKCPACGHPEMVAKTLDETLSYGNQSLTLHTMRGEFCPACGEGVWDAESYRRYTFTVFAALISASVRLRLHINLRWGYGSCRGYRIFRRFGRRLSIPSWHRVLLCSLTEALASGAARRLYASVNLGPPLQHRNRQRLAAGARSRLGAGHGIGDTYRRQIRVVLGQRQNQTLADASRSVRRSP